MHLHNATRFLKLASLHLPASRAIEVGAWSVGRVAIGAGGFDLRPGGLYRARIALHGLAKLASKSRLIVEFSKLGFSEVQAWDNPKDLPSDWPATERGHARSGVTWWAQGRYQGLARTLDPQAAGEDVEFLWVGEVAPPPAPRTPPPASTPPPPASTPPPDAPPKPTSGAALDVWALGVIDRAWPQVHGRAPMPSERLFTAAMARGESKYGTGYGAAKNWGSIHAKGKPPCPEGSIPWTDHDAQGNEYPCCMRAYSTDEDGAADLIRQITTKRPVTWTKIQQGRPLPEIAEALRAERYYEAPAATYAKMLRNNLNVILKSADLTDPFVGGPGPSSPPVSPAKESDSGAGAVLALGALALGALALRRK